MFGPANICRMGMRPVELIGQSAAELRASRGLRRRQQTLTCCSPGFGHQSVIEVETRALSLGALFKRFRGGSQRSSQQLSPRPRLRLVRDQVVADLEFDAGQPASL